MIPARRCASGPLPGSRLASQRQLSKFSADNSQKMQGVRRLFEGKIRFGLPPESSLTKNVI
jgi:hypothetical protein